MAPRSLTEMCIRVCIKNVANITDVGDLGYKTIRPVLLKVTSADQLRQIEESSPQIKGEDAELWRKLIERDFPGWRKKNYVPKNPESWHKVYARYKREHIEEMAAAEAKLVSAFATLEKEKNAHTSKIVDQRLLPKPPRDGRGLSRAAGSSATRVPKFSGSSLLQKAKREAREIKNRRILSTPTGALAVPPGQIKKAPEAMVNEYRIREHATMEVRIKAPRLSRPTRDLELERREARLRAAKVTLTSSKAEVVISDTDENDENELGEDDLFGDKELSPVASPVTSRKAEKQPALTQKTPAAEKQHVRPQKAPASIIQKAYASEIQKTAAAAQKAPAAAALKISAVATEKSLAPLTTLKRRSGLLNNSYGASASRSITRRAPSNSNDRLTERSHIAAVAPNPASSPATKSADRDTLKKPVVPIKASHAVKASPAPKRMSRPDAYSASQRPVIKGPRRRSQSVSSTTSRGSSRHSASPAPPSPSPSPSERSPAPKPQLKPKLAPSSSANSGEQPPVVRKRKAAADIFMPNKVVRRSDEKYKR